MGMSKLIVLMAATGSACASPTAVLRGIVELHRAPDGKVAVATPDRVSDLAGNSLPGTGVAGRNEVVAYDTLFTPAGDLNIASIPVSGCLSIPILPIGAICDGTPFGITPCLVFDNATPTDPSDDVVTDVIFDDFHANPADLPGGIDDRYTLAQVQFAMLVRNVEVFDNGTPGDPSDDFPDIRTNQFRSGFFGVTDDGGTPGDPTDDTFAFTDGYTANFTWPPNVDSLFELTVDLRGGGIEAPGRGLVVHDWANEAIFGTTNTLGLTPLFAGGDADPSTPSGQPGAASQINNAGPIDLGYWEWGSSTQADPALDGDASDVSFVDVRGSSPAIVNWQFDLGGGLEVASQLPMRFTYDFADQVCPIDYGGPLDPDTPDGVLTGADFFSFLGLFQAGDARADLAGPNDPTTPDGALTGADFFRFLELFQNGCVL